MTIYLGCFWSYRLRDCLISWPRPITDLGWPLPPLSLSCGKTAVTKLRTHSTFFGRPGEDWEGCPNHCRPWKQLSHVLLESVLCGQPAKHPTAEQSPSAQPWVSKAPHLSPTATQGPTTSAEKWQMSRRAECQGWFLTVWFPIHNSPHSHF